MTFFQKLVSVFLLVTTIWLTVMAMRIDTAGWWMATMFSALVTLFVAALFWNLPKSVEVDEDGL